jgi:hypothetical protein
MQLIPATLIVLVSIQSGGIAYLVPALILCLSVSFYAVAITVRLTGLTPNVLVYDAKVLFVYLILIGSALIVLIGLAFFNPWYAIVSLLLFLPAWLLVKSGYKKWEAAEQSGF